MQRIDRIERIGASDDTDADDVRSPALRGRIQGPVEEMLTVSEPSRPHPPWQPESVITSSIIITIPGYQAELALDVPVPVPVVQAVECDGGAPGGGGEHQVLRS